MTLNGPVYTKRVNLIVFFFYIYARRESFSASAWAIWKSLNDLYICDICSWRCGQCRRHCLSLSLSLYMHFARRILNFQRVLNSSFIWTRIYNIHPNNRISIFQYIFFFLAFFNQIIYLYIKIELLYDVERRCIIAKCFHLLSERGSSSSRRLLLLHCWSSPSRGAREILLRLKFNWILCESMKWPGKLQWLIKSQCPGGIP